MAPPPFPDAPRPVDEDAGPPSPPIVGRRFARMLYMLAMVAALAALVVHVTHVFGWRVDPTAVGLIGVLLLIPIAEQLNKLKVGSLEAEFAERDQRLGGLENRVVDIREQATETRVEVDARTGPAEAAIGIADAPHLIQRLVWADDNHAHNRLEIAELGRRFDVAPVSSTGQAIVEVTKSPGDTAVITDAVRLEDGVQNVEAGLELITELSRAFEGIPIYVYCGSETAIRQRDRLLDAGAKWVTPSFTELARVIRTDARAGFEATVREILRAAGELVHDSHGLDYLVAVGHHRVGVETRDFRRAPPPPGIAAPVARLQQCLMDDVIDEGFLVAPRDVFSGAHGYAVPPGITLISVQDLPAALADRADAG